MMPSAVLPASHLPLAEIELRSVRPPGQVTVSVGELYDQLPVAWHARASPPANSSTVRGDSPAAQ
jgi:hypothetical protein